MRNAEAARTDNEVVTDGNLITSRNPGDLPAFVDAVTNAVSDSGESRAS